MTCVQETVKEGFNAVFCKSATGELFDAAYAAMHMFCVSESDMKRLKAMKDGLEQEVSGQKRVIAAQEAIVPLTTTKMEENQKAGKACANLVNRTSV